jgi:hypothetical protein
MHSSELLPYRVRRISLAHWLLALMLCNVTLLVRDTFNLPLFGERIYLVNLYVVALALLICGFATRHPRSRGSGHFALLGILAAFALAMIIRELAVEQKSFVGIGQWLVFAALLVYLKSGASRTDVESVTDAFLFVTCVAAVFQAFVILARGGAVENIVQLQRNELAYMCLFGAALAYILGRNASVVAVVAGCAIISAIANSTRGAFLFTVVMLMLFLFQRIITLRRTARLAVGALLLTGLIGLPVFGAAILQDYFGWPGIQELVQVGQYRYYIEDNITSFMGRLYSALFTLTEWWQSDSALFGLGEHAVNYTSFWGYPNHNYFVSVVAGYGAVGIGVALYLFLSAARLTLQSLVLPVLLVFTLGVANDLYPWLALLLAVSTFPVEWFRRAEFSRRLDFRRA